jgi:hypothetical protein
MPHDQGALMALGKKEAGPSDMPEDLVPYIE